MRIAVLGPLEVWTDDGRPVAVPGAKERLLLALLAAASPDVVSTDRIVETLWNGNRPASARKSLQVHLVHLRSALEPDRPAGRRPLRRPPRHRLRADDGRRRRRCPAGRRAGRARARPAGRRGRRRRPSRLLSAALGLWRGEPYGDWPDASFADAERRRLAEVRAGRRTPLLEARLALGEDAEVVAEAERLLADDPLKEEWWRLLVLALYRSGRQGDALAAVARARAVLVEQLGAEPGPRLRAVEAAVLAQDPALDLPSSPAPPPSGRRGLPLQGPGHLPGGRRRAVPRPRPGWSPSSSGGWSTRRCSSCPVPSGAGKSSLVRAGLVPALAAGALPGSERWRAVVVTPGRRPLDALAGLAGDGAAEPPVAPGLRPVRGALGTGRRTRPTGLRSSTPARPPRRRGRRAVRRGGAR